MKKKIFAIAIATMMVAGLTACSNGSADTQAPATDNGPSTFTFTYNGTQLVVNEEAADAVAALGEPVSKTETESCAFQGMDKQYIYGGFELDTYQQSADGPDLVLSIIFNDDTVETEEGICIGNSLSMVKDKYGEPSSEGTDSVTYVKGSSTLTFFYNDTEAVDGIQYYAVTE